MPNGGTMPCCKVCQYSKSTTTNQDELLCEKHDLSIIAPWNTFCADISSKHSPGLSEFAHKQKFKPSMMYHWDTSAYTNPEYPDLPQYHHKPTAIGTMQEYRERTTKTDYTVIKPRITVNKVRRV